MLPAGQEDLKISFGSCYALFDATSDIFETISAAKPDLFVWLGDAFYADSTDGLFTTMTEEYYQERINKTVNSKDYDKLSHIVGVWDDHDYGQNNAGLELKDKDRNREMYLDFVNEPTTSERRL